MRRREPGTIVMRSGRSFQSASISGGAPTDGRPEEEPPRPVEAPAGAGEVCLRMKALPKTCRSMSRLSHSSKADCWELGRSSSR